MSMIKQVVSTRLSKNESKRCLELKISKRCLELYHPRNAWYAFVGERRNMANSVHFIEAIHTHKAVDEPFQRSRSDCKQVSAMPLYSKNLGLTGRADIIEWRYNIPIPVETKTGKVRDFENFHIQIGLQAMCLEEMFGVNVPYGEILFSEMRRRSEILIDEDIKKRCASVVTNLRDSFLSFEIAWFERVNDHRCHNCQYRESCIPPILKE